MLTHRSRGNEIITTDLVAGSMLTTIMVSLRLPSTGSSSRWSMPSRRMLTRLVPTQGGSSGFCTTWPGVGAGLGRRGCGTATISGRDGTVMAGPYGIWTCVDWNWIRTFQLARNNQPKQNPPSTNVVKAKLMNASRGLKPRRGEGGGRSGAKSSGDGRMALRLSGARLGRAHYTIIE